MHHGKKRSSQSSYRLLSKPVVQRALEQVEMLLSEAQDEARWGSWCQPWMERQVNMQLKRAWHTEVYSGSLEIDLSPQKLPGKGMKSL